MTLINIKEVVCFYFYSWLSSILYLLNWEQRKYIYFYFLIVVQVQLSPLSHHHFPVPHPPPAPTLNPTPLGLFPWVLYTCPLTTFPLQRKYIKSLICFKVLPITLKIFYWMSVNFYNLKM